MEEIFLQYFNVRNICSGSPFGCVVKHSKVIDVIGLNETRLESKVPTLVVNIENYQIYPKDRNTAVGGVPVYVKETLPHFQRLDITDQDLEVVGIEITPKNAKSLVILCW